MWRFVINYSLSFLVKFVFIFFGMVFLFAIIVFADMESIVFTKEKGGFNIINFHQKGG